MQHTWSSRRAEEIFKLWMKIHSISKCPQIFWCLALARIQVCSLDLENLDLSLLETVTHEQRIALDSAYLGHH